MKNNPRWGGNRTRTTILMGVAIGAAIGVGYAVTRRRRSAAVPDRWASSARQFSKRLSDESADMASKSREIFQRAQNMYNEGVKIVEDATELWSHGRRLVGA